MTDKPYRCAPRGVNDLAYHVDIQKVESYRKHFYNNEVAKEDYGLLREFPRLNMMKARLMFKRYLQTSLQCSKRQLFKSILPVSKTSKRVLKDFKGRLLARSTPCFNSYMGLF